LLLCEGTGKEDNEVEDGVNPDGSGIAPFSLNISFAVLPLKILYPIILNGSWG
jgi:hypothetical protein